MYFRNCCLLMVCIISLAFHAQGANDLGNIQGTLLFLINDAKARLLTQLYDDVCHFLIVYSEADTTVNQFTRGFPQRVPINIINGLF